MTIRLPDAKHERLRRLAERNGISLNMLVEEWASVSAMCRHHHGSAVTVRAPVKSQTRPACRDLGEIRAGHVIFLQRQAC